MVRTIRENNKNKKTMMKKNYEKPTIVVEEFVTEAGFLVASDQNQGNIGGVGGEAGDGDLGANDRRGGWGDLWN